MANGPNMQLDAHEQTYGAFLKLLRYGAIASFVLAAIVVVLISY